MNSMSQIAPKIRAVMAATFRERIHVSRVEFLWSSTVFVSVVCSSTFSSNEVMSSPFYGRLWPAPSNPFAARGSAQEQDPEMSAFPRHDLPAAIQSKNTLPRRVAAGGIQPGTEIFLLVLQHPCHPARRRGFCVR